ncbi:hypothetical protein B0H19DRAFT_1073632 [Mycena capillaripes]|nr:hypothetical protein B0H19DRAFT_1073632 [Mycena capillaripes]
MSLPILRGDHINATTAEQPPELPPAINLVLYGLTTWPPNEYASRIELLKAKNYNKTNEVTGAIVLEFQPQPHRYDKGKQPNVPAGDNYGEDQWGGERQEFGPKVLYGEQPGISDAGAQWSGGGRSKQRRLLDRRPHPTQMLQVDSGENYDKAKTHKENPCGNTMAVRTSEDEQKPNNGSDREEISRAENGRGRDLNTVYSSTSRRTAYDDQCGVAPPHPRWILSPYVIFGAREGGIQPMAPALVFLGPRTGSSFSTFAALGSAEVLSSLLPAFKDGLGHNLLCPMVLMQ